MELAQRKTRFMLGILLAFLPFVLWIIVPVAFFDRIAAFFRIESRLGEDYAFLIALISEVVAIYFLRRSRQRPRDWLSVWAFILIFFSGLGIFVFFEAIVANTLQGW